MDYSKHIPNRTNKGTPVPQSEPLPGKKMKRNNAGGFTFTVSDWDRLDRFLILGSEGGTYYVGERKLTRDNCKNIEKCIKEDGLRVVNRVVEISDAGRAPKNDPALFVLALCAAADDVETRRAALAALPKVARIGTHLFHFAQFVQSFRGWGRALREAIANWYQDRDLDDLVNQVIKYKQRDGWSHRDLLRLSHPKTADADRNTLYKWVVKPEDVKELPASLARVQASLDIVGADAKKAVKLINEYRLPREVVPTELLNDVKVWEALLESMPMTAMIRNLAKMTAVGLLKPMSEAAKTVAARLNDEAVLQKARVHPISVLAAMKTYQQGHGEKGSLTWTPLQSIVDALDEAFYKCFQFVVPTNKRWLLGLDVSGSMGGGYVTGIQNLTPRECTAAMALVTAKTEKDYFIHGFSNVFVPLDISPRMRLDTVIRNISGLPFQGTDCALPMTYALQHKIPVDAFVVYTDNETWAGAIHPSKALEQYRQKMGIPAKLIVVGTAATEFTIADPDDAGMLDVVGFDTAAPALIADFARDEE